MYVQRVTGIIFITWLTYTIAISEYNSYQFELRKDMTNTISTQHVLYTTTTVNLIECARICAENTHCLSMFYNKINEKCSGHDVIYSSMSSSGITLQANSKYWVVVKPFSKLGCEPLNSTPGYCLKLRSEILMWAHQSLACFEDHMTMASLSSTDKYDFSVWYLNKIGHSSAVAVGAVKSSPNIWTWNDSTPVNMSIFGPGEPTNGSGEDCGMLAAATNFKLNDAQCGNPRAFLCQKMIYV